MLDTEDAQDVCAHGMAARPQIAKAGMAIFHTALPSRHQQTSEWTSGLFDVCSGGSRRCVYTFACAPCMFGYVAERVPPGSNYKNNCCMLMQMPTSLPLPVCCCCRVPVPCLGSLVVTDMRARLRKTYNLAEDEACWFGDDCATQVCMPCVLIQMAHQVDRVAEENGGVYPMTDPSPPVRGDGYVMYPSTEYILYSSSWFRSTGSPAEAVPRGVVPPSHPGSINSMHDPPSMPRFSCDA